MLFKLIVAFAMTKLGREIIADFVVKHLAARPRPTYIRKDYTR